LWGYVKSKAYENNPLTIQQLKQEITRIICDITPEMCLEVMENFSKRIVCCRKSRGGHLADIVFHV
jgi:hypothetical protein